MDRRILYFWYGRALFMGQSTDTAVHHHYAIQIVIGLNQPFGLHFSNRRYKYRAAMIGANQTHQLDGRGDWQAILLVDPETELAQQLDHEHLQDGNIIALNEAFPEAVFKKLSDFVSRERSCQEAEELCGCVIDALIKTPVPRKKINPKILQVVDYLDKLPRKRVSIEDIADNVYLSESRIIHLFKEQMGIPIRRYLLWLRVIEAIKEIFQGVSFTTAAHEAGFSDSAHLSRTFKQMFGITLSELFKKNSQFVQAISCLQSYI
jgi:AraC-like DNA-binding protein